MAFLVRKDLGFDPFSPCLFVFCNRKRNKIKIQWETNGFWLHYGHLERRTTFEWPDQRIIPFTMNISYRQLRWLLILKSE
ncbi:IS66 family insertion sequence element accessory protein TnpB [Anaerobacillus arseniciselenatis]|uniref:IS66 family insertion sequence element accessory protein TnpB n=1 Tax=Anaerobacillus arseniciselenatis TaxID=85682 RepID=UPI0009FC7825